MPTYLIAYDLADTAQNRAALTTAIMGLGEAWARPLDGTWFVRTEASAGAIEGLLAPLLGEDDALMVQPVRGEAILCNTTARWFRPRRSDARTEAASNVVAFPCRATSEANLMAAS